MRKLVSLIVLAILPNIAFAQVKIIKAPANYEFSDMGYDSVTGQVGIVGYEVAGATKTAKVFGMNATQDGFTATTLTGLGPNTLIGGISSDGSRIAGVSKSPGSIDVGEGTTWLRSTPNSPVATGYCPGSVKTSVGLAAWKDGIVGDCAGLDVASKWTAATGTVNIFGVLNGRPNAQATGISANGAIVSIYADHENPDGAAYYWDSTGIHKLQDPYNVQSIPLAVSPSGNYIGGWVGEIDQFDNGYLNAAVWDPNRNLILLKDSNGNRFEGRVFDISDLGYAVGETKDGKGFIWHPSFDGVQSSYKGAQIFDTWLATIPNGAVLSPESKGVEAIAEDKINGKLIFALSDYQAPGASFYVSAVVAGVGVGGGEIPTHVGTTGNDTFNINIKTANQRVYVQGLGGNDTINITVTAGNANVKVEAGAGSDKITLTANNISNLKFTTLSSDGADNVTLNSTSGNGIDANFDLGEGNDTFNLYLQNVRNAIVGVKAQGGIDKVTSSINSSQAVVTAYDMGAGDDSIISNLSSSDLNLAINDSLGNNYLNLNAASSLLTQGVILGNGRNTISGTNSTISTSVIAYNFGYGANTYNALHTYTSASQVTFVEPVLAAGVANNTKLTLNRASNMNIDYISPNAGNVNITNLMSTGFRYKKSSIQPAGVSSGTQVYNQIVNTFNPYN